MSSSSSISIEDESFVSSYRYRNTPKGYQFSAGVRHPLIYFVGTTHGKRKYFNRKQNKANYFEKAFKWYTKEIGKGKSEKSGDNKNEDLVGFASWLDMKYEEYIQDASNCKNGKYNNKARPCTNDTCHALEMNLKSFEVLMEPKDVTSKAASVCYYQAATAGPGLMEEEKKCVRMPTTKSENNTTDAQTVTQLITAQIFHEYIEKSKRPPCCDPQNTDQKQSDAPPKPPCQCDLHKILNRRKDTAICQCPSIVNKCAETQCSQGDYANDKAPPPPPPTPEPKGKDCCCENIVKTADKLQQISKPNIKFTDKGNDPDVKQCESCATNIPEVKQVKDRGCCPRDMDVQTSTHSFVVVSKFRVKHLNKAIEPPYIPASKNVHSCVPKPAPHNVHNPPEKVDADAQTSVKSLHLGKDITTKDINFPVYLRVIYDDKQVQKN